MANSENDSTIPAPSFIFTPPSQITITASSFTTLAFCIVGILLRLYTRLCITRQAWWDDLCITFVLLCVIAQSILTQLMVNNGLGLYFQDINTSQLTMLFQANYLSLGFFSLSVGFIKIALLLQFTRILGRESFAYKATLVLQVFVCFWTMAFGFISWVPCFPIAKAWDLRRPGRCYGLGTAKVNIQQFLATFLAHASSNLAIDCIILALAGHLAWRLGSKQPSLRLRLCALLSVGFIVNVSALIRVILIVRQLQSALHESTRQDPSWIMAVGVTYLNVEVNLSALCASIPVFWLPIQQAVTHQWNRILVTNEVSITSTMRQSESIEHLTGRVKAANGRMLLAFGKVSLHGSVADSPHGSSLYYRDEFVQSHVDPLTLESATSVQTTISSDPRS